MDAEIPQTSGDAERSLRHALDHVRGDLILYHLRECEAACLIIRYAIDRVQWQQPKDELAAYIKERFGIEVGQ